MKLQQRFLLLVSVLMIFALPTTFILGLFNVIDTDVNLYLVLVGVLLVGLHLQLKILNSIAGK